MRNRIERPLIFLTAAAILFSGSGSHRVAAATSPVFCETEEERETEYIWEEDIKLIEEKASFEAETDRLSSAGEGEEAQKPVTEKVLRIGALGRTVNVYVTLDDYVVYNGKKHIPLINGDSHKETREDCVRDLSLTVSCDLLSCSEVGYIIKNNMDANNKRGKLIIKFKATGNANSYEKALINAVNRKLKKKPFTFSVRQADLNDLNCQVVQNDDGTRVKRVIVDQNGGRIKLTKRDYRVIEEEGSFCVEGKFNYKGRYSLPKKAREAEEQAVKNSEEAAEEMVTVESDWVQPEEEEPWEINTYPLSDIQEPEEGLVYQLFEGRQEPEEEIESKIQTGS